MKKFKKIVFSKRLKKLRLQNNFTQIQLAKKIKIPATTISHFECTKDSRKPSIENIFKLSQALKTSIDYLTGL